MGRASKGACVQHQLHLACRFVAGVTQMGWWGWGIDGGRGHATSNATCEAARGDKEHASHIHIPCIVCLSTREPELACFLISWAGGARRAALTATA